MKNITIAVAEEVYRAARRKAAERDTSVSRLVADFLRSFSREDELRSERIKQMDQLFASMDRGPKRKPVGRLKRDQIYGRSLR